MAPVRHFEDARFLKYPSSASTDVGTAACWAAKDDLSINPAHPAYYADGLGCAIADVDARRAELVKWSADVSNLRAGFNTLLVPLTGGFLLNSSSVSNATTLTRLGATALAYLTLSSQVPDLDKFYLDASQRMFCAMVQSRPYLYSRAAIEQIDDKDSSKPASLDGIINRLDKAIAKFEQTRRALVPQLRLKPTPAPASPVLFTDKVIADLRGDASGSKRPDETTIDYLYNFTFEQMTNADAVLSDARDVRAEIREAPGNLRTSWIGIEREQQLALVTKVPAYTNPADAIKAIRASLAEVTAAVATAEAARVDDGPSTASVGRPSPWNDPLVASKYRTALSVGAQRCLDELEASAQDMLNAAEDAKRWVAAHDQRKLALAAESEAVGCQTPLSVNAKEDTATPLRSKRRSTPATSTDFTSSVKPLDRAP